MTRCEAIVSADEYCKFETQCELEENHEGPHKVFLGGCSFRLWENIKVKMSKKKKKKNHFLGLLPPCRGIQSCQK